METCKSLYSCVYDLYNIKHNEILNKESFKIHIIASDMKDSYDKAFAVLKARSKRHEANRHEKINFEIISIKKQEDFNDIIL